MVTEFRKHADRVRVQYAQLKRLKENLPHGEVIAQMNFAENYLCQSCDEVQSAYWNSTMVSLHPIVIYFKDMRMASCNTKASFTRQMSFPTI